MDLLKKNNIIQRTADDYYLQSYETYLQSEMSWAEEVTKSDNAKNRMKLTGLIIDKDSPLKIMLDACKVMDSKAGGDIISDDSIGEVGITPDKDTETEKLVYDALSCMSQLYNVRARCNNRHSYGFDSEAVKKKLKEKIKDGTKVFGVEPSFKLDEICGKVEERYSMLKRLDEQCFFHYKWENNFSKELANYINLVDLTFATKKKA
jgi:hypothetical protein